MNAALNGEEIINFVSGDGEDDSGSGSGSGSSGDSGENEITEGTDPPPTEPDNTIDDGNGDGNVFAGGVKNSDPGSKGNSASRHHVGMWLLISTLWVFLAALIA